MLPFREPRRARFGPIQQGEEYKVESVRLLPLGKLVGMRTSFEWQRGKWYPVQF